MVHMPGNHTNHVNNQRSDKQNRGIQLLPVVAARWRQAERKDSIWSPGACLFNRRKMSIIDELAYQCRESERQLAEKINSKINRKVCVRKGILYENFADGLLLMIMTISTHSPSFHTSFPPPMELIVCVTTIPFFKMIY